MHGATQSCALELIACGSIRKASINPADRITRLVTSAEALTHWEKLALRNSYWSPARVGTLPLASKFVPSQRSGFG